MQNFRLKIDQDHINLKEPLIFSGGEVHVDISSLPTECSSYLLRVRLQSSEDIMHMLLLADALTRRYPNCTGAIQIPYLPYARQDRMCSDGQHFGLDVIMRLLSGLKQKLYFYDVHSNVARELAAFYGLDCTFVDQDAIIKDYGELSKQIQDGEVVLVSPDKGAFYKTLAIGVRSRTQIPVLVGSKVRDSATGKITGFDVNSDDLAGKDVLICDDICDAGGTFIGLAKLLKERNCGKITLFVTHGIFSKGLEPFVGVIDKIVTTNTFRLNYTLNTEGIDFRVIQVL